MGGEAVCSPVPEDQQHPQVLSTRTYNLYPSGRFVKRFGGVLEFSLGESEVIWGQAGRGGSSSWRQLSSRGLSCTCQVPNRLISPILLIFA